MKLSRLEYEVLQIICDMGESTAPGVHESIAESRDTAYSTIKTIFDRLEKKGAIYRKSRIGRTSIYAPKVSQEAVQKSLVQDFLKNVFPKDRTPLLNTLVRESNLTKEEIQYLKNLLKEK